jgi:hypothetical protein
MTMRALVATLLTVVPLALLAGCGAPAGPMPECITSADCPPSGDECVPAACVVWACSNSPLPPGTRVGTQPDCHIRYCDDAGAVQVAIDPPNCVPEFTSAWLSAPVEPDVPVVLEGRHFYDATVVLGGQTLAATVSADGTTITFLPPPHIAGFDRLYVTTPYGSVAPYFYYASRRSKTRTLIADGDLADWDFVYSAASSTAPPDPTPADVLRRLYVAYDPDGLWLAIDGGTASSPANGLVIYIDPAISWPPHPGVVDMTTLTDNGSPLSDACASIVQIGPGWSPMACVGTVGMASVAAGQVAPATGSAGIRWLSPADHFDWRLAPGGGSLATVAAATAPEAVEFFLPWSTLGLAPYPADQTFVGLAAAIVGPDGLSASTQLLPYSGTAGVFNYYVAINIVW